MIAPFRRNIRFSARAKAPRNRRYRLFRLRHGDIAELRCAALAQLGRIDEAREYLGHVRIGQPQLTLQWIREGVPYQTPETMERFLEGMRKAGVKEA